MAMLYQAEAEQARLDSLGTDLGMTQDELLADFEASDDAEDVTVNISDAGSSSGAAVVSGSDKEDGPGYIKAGATDIKEAGQGYIKATGDEPVKEVGLGYIKTGDTVKEAGPGYIKTAAIKDAGPGYIKTAESGPVKEAGPGYIKTAASSETLREQLGGVASVAALRREFTSADEAGRDVILDPQSAASLDQFTQAMAGFGAQTSFDGLNPYMGDDPTKRDLLTATHRNSNPYALA